MAGENKKLEVELQNLGLKQKPLEFILEKGEKFIDSPEILAKKFSIPLTSAKQALNIIKRHRDIHISKEVKRFGKHVKKNRNMNLNEIALLYDFDDIIVTEFLKGKEKSSLTDLAKQAIKEKYNSGYSITEIANQLRVSEINIGEYVENTFITFTGREGKRALETIQKYFEMYPIMKLRELIVTKDVELQEKICFDLLRIDKNDYEDIEEYFMKFDESENFFKIEEDLSIEAKTYIRASSIDNTRKLSVQINRMQKVIRDYLLRFDPDKSLLLHCAEEQLRKIQIFGESFWFKTLISHTTYRLIITNSFRDLIQYSKSLVGSLPKKILNELLPLAFYYIKCSLPLDELTQIISNITHIPLTTLDLFHLIFQMSDPVVRGLCIEHYSFSNPVPFYYPILRPYCLGQTSCQFEICKELWYSLQQFSGLVSFGLGWASWNPIGKSHLLDLMFETDFAKGSPQNSPFHLNSIDIQMTKNLFGLKDGNESTRWAYIDCNGCSDFNIIKAICKNLDIALIHVTHSDFSENYIRIEEELNIITVNTKRVYVFVRDCPENGIEMHKNVMSAPKITVLFIPNLVKQQLSSDLKKIGYQVLHSDPRFAEINFLGHLIKEYDSWDNSDTKLIEAIKKYIYAEVPSKCEANFPFLSYYPHFVEYMSCYYEASGSMDQKEIDELNRKCEILAKHLQNTKISAIVWCFNEILAKENSTLLLWKLFR